LGGGAEAAAAAAVATELSADPPTRGGRGNNGLITYDDKRVIDDKRGDAPVGAILSAARGRHREQAALLTTSLIFMQINGDKDEGSP